jgi:hypothetical protein
MKKIQHAERGQTLVIMIFGLIGLLMVAGLAIDGGMITLERRRMQNGADASSVGGTRKLAEIMCDDGVSATAGDAAIWAEVKHYAQSNGVEDPDNNVVAEYMGFNADGEAAPFVPRTYVGNAASGGIGIPNGASGISATVEISRSTYFVSLMGIESASASAPAVAMTGPPITGGGMRPFGVPIQLVGDLDPSDPSNNTFSVSFKNDGGDITWAGGNTAQHRGWMNMGYVWNQGEDPDFPRAIDDNAGASDLKEWMEDGWNGTIYADCRWSSGCRWGDYIHAKPGTNSSAICKAPQDTVITIPVYDYIPDCPTEPIPDPKPACPTQGGGYCYHIVGFAAMEITECSQGGGLITAELKRLITGKGTPSPSSGYGSEVCEKTTMWSVSLWE